MNQLKKHLGKEAIPNPKLPLVTSSGKIKIDHVAVLQCRLIPQSNGNYDIPVPQWLIQWENLNADEATWEDAAFIHATFPHFKP
jgi:hypothetical protein